MMARTMVEMKVHTSVDKTGWMMEQSRVDWMVGSLAESMAVPMVQEKAVPMDCLMVRSMVEMKVHTSVDKTGWMMEQSRVDWMAGLLVASMALPMASQRAV